MSPRFFDVVPILLHIPFLLVHTLYVKIEFRSKLLEGARYVAFLFFIFLINRLNETESAIFWF